MLTSIQKKTAPRFSKNGRALREIPGIVTKKYEERLRAMEVLLITSNDTSGSIGVPAPQASALLFAFIAVIPCRTHAKFAICVDPIWY